MRRQICLTCAASAAALAISSQVRATVATFQNGDLNGYAGTRDNHIVQSTPDDNNGNAGALFIQHNNSNYKQGNIKFNNLFTSTGEVNKLPLGATINSATLQLTSTNAGNGRFSLHRLLTDWNEGNGTAGALDTWNSWGNGVSPRNSVPGVQLDDVEAASLADDTSPAGHFSSVTGVSYAWNVSASMRIFAAQADLSPHGWVLEGLEGAGNTGFASRQNNTQANRPLLTVDWSPTLAWLSDVDGDWSQGGNWTGGDVPDTAGDAARLGSVIAQPRTVNVDLAHTIGSLTFDDADGYAVTGAAPLTFEQAGGSPSNAFVHVATGSHSISAPLVLNKTTDITVAGASDTLTVSGAISGAAGQGLGKFGSGTAVLTNTNSYSGTTTIAGGTLAISSAAALGDESATNDIVFSLGGALRTDAPITTSRNITIHSGGAVVNTNGFDSTFSGTFSGDATLFKGGAGNLTIMNGSLGGLSSNDGTLTIGAGGSFTTTSAGTGSGNTTISGGNLTVDGALTANKIVSASDHTLTVNGTVTHPANGSTNRTSTVYSVVMGPTGQWDLADNDLVVRDGDIGTWTGGAYDGVSGYVARGFAGDDDGITSSMPDAATLLTAHAVGLAAEVLGIGASDTALWSGQTINGEAVLVKYTWGGDAQMDGDLDGDDYFQIDANVAQSGSVFGYTKGDFNYDGVINGDDYFIIDGNIAFAQTQPPFSSSDGAGGLTAVPEPATLGSVALAGAILLRRRRTCMASVTS